MKTSPEKVMGHTKGKLTADDDTICDSDGEPIAHLEWSGYHEADARRLVTCWNALSSVPTEWLESFGDGIIEQIQENVALKQERDALIHDNAQLYQSLQGEMKGRLEAEAERDELVKALRSARDYLDEQYPMVDASELLDEEIDPILSRYPEKNA